MSLPNNPHMPNLPGFDAMADTFEFVKNMWGGMQTPTGIPGMAMPTLSLEEINKQIADLKAVESWLNVNMTMLRGTIQALEVQSATIATLNAMGAAFGAEMKPNVTPSNASNTTQYMADKAQPDHADSQKSTPAADANPMHANAAADATTAWWSALQTQFNQAVNSVMADEASAKQKGTTPVKPAPKTDTTAAKKSAAKSGAESTRKKTKAAPKTAAKSAVKKRTSSTKS